MSKIGQYAGNSVESRFSDSNFDVSPEGPHMRVRNRPHTPPPWEPEPVLQAGRRNTLRAAPVSGWGLVSVFGGLGALTVEGNQLFQLKSTIQLGNDSKDSWPILWGEGFLDDHCTASPPLLCLQGSVSSPVATASVGLFPLAGWRALLAPPPTLCW